MVFFIPRKPILTVHVGGNELCRISKSDLPVDSRPPACHLKVKGQEVVFKEPDGFKTTHSLGEETGWFLFSIRVHGNLGCQADCIFGKEKSPTGAEPGTQGIRFQPFFLGDARIAEEEMRGRGLFPRGLHFPGQVTSGSVSLSCICDSCRESFRIWSFHAGFGNCGYMYSDSGLFTIVIPDHIQGSPPARGKANMEEVACLEALLPNAPDGTSFRYRNPLRCPHCAYPYIDFERFPADRENEYYGNTFPGRPAITYDPEQQG